MAHAKRAQLAMTFVAKKNFIWGFRRVGNQSVLIRGGMPAGKFQFSNREALRVLAGACSIQRSGQSFMQLAF
ncbi:MAG: hypothetical protein H7238_00355 [Polaromonas sp.]|nr:hypothetical protein [Polaromonas sp.]